METDFFGDGKYDVPIVDYGLGQRFSNFNCKESPERLLQPQTPKPHTSRTFDSVGGRGPESLHF